VIEVAAGVTARVAGVALRHASPSVANNYAVYSRGGRVALERCTICSETGSGVGCDGGELELVDCMVQGCARNGLVIAGDLDGGAGAARLPGCAVEGNGGSGVIALDGAQIEAAQCCCSRNRQHGLKLRVHVSLPALRAAAVHIRMSS
jgi:hypothetical protein